MGEKIKLDPYLRTYLKYQFQVDCRSKYERQNNNKALRRYLNKTGKSLIKEKIDSRISLKIGNVYSKRYH